MSEPPRKVADFLSPEEIRELTETRDAHGFAALLTTWALIAGSFALVAQLPRWWTVVIALIVIGGRQLALSILMHEAAHRSLFRTRGLNDLLGKWLCAAPVWGCVERYRRHHLGHHAHTNTQRDPDLGLIEPFPTTVASLLRKFSRDLLGLTGLRRIVALLAMDLGFLSYTASTNARRLPAMPIARRLRLGLRHLGPVALTNLGLGLTLWASGHGLLYLLWVGAYLSSFSLFVRIRAIAEHACTPRTRDPFRNTRTTRANWIARLTVAPLRVNFHLEHHLLPTVPCHKLPRMHRLLRERGALSGCELENSYLAVFCKVVSPITK